MQPTIPSGFRNNPSSLQQTTYELRRRDRSTVGYRFDRFGRARRDEVEVDGTHRLDIDVDAVASTADRSRLPLGGVTRRYLVDQVGSTSSSTDPTGARRWWSSERFPHAADQLAEGSALAPMPGGVVRVAVAEGDTVEPGQLLVVLEAMKMEHAVHAAAAGTVVDGGRGRRRPGRDRAGPGGGRADAPERPVPAVSRPGRSPGG